MMINSDEYDYDENDGLDFEDENREGEEDDFAELDAFLEELSKMGKEYALQPKVIVPDPARLREFMGALKAMGKIAGNTRGIDLTWSMDDGRDLPGAAVITIEADELVVKNVPLFVEAIRYASNVEFYPLENGRMKIDASFYGMFDVTELEG